MRKKQIPLDGGRAFIEEIERIEAFRQSLSPEEQAAFLKDSFLALSEDDRKCYFGLFFKAVRRTCKGKFTLLQGGRA